MHARGRGGVNRVDLDLPNRGRRTRPAERQAQTFPSDANVRAVGDVEEIDPHYRYRRGSSAQEGKAMLIGEVAKRSGVSAKTLRYYEDIGLVEPADRSPSGYRDFDGTVLERLAFIRSSQALGLSLGEIRSIIALRDNGAPPCAHVLELLRARAEDIGRTIRELRRLQADLHRLVARAEELDPADCSPRHVCHLIG